MGTVEQIPGKQLNVGSGLIILHKLSLINVSFLAATAALEVQMLVCLSVYPSHLLQLF